MKFILLLLIAQIFAVKKSRKQFNDPFMDQFLQHKDLADKMGFVANGAEAMKDFIRKSAKEDQEKLAKK